MKIVAITDNSQYNRKFLVEATEDELKKISGDARKDRGFKIDDGINVSIIYSKYKSITGNKRRLKEIKDVANLILDSIEKIRPVIENLAEKD